MKLNDLRRMAVRRKFRVRFPLPGGMECLIDEHGVARVPRLHSPPSFNLEDELARAPEFVLEPLERGRATAAARPLSRGEMEQWLAGAESASSEQPAEPEE